MLNVGHGLANVEPVVQESDAIAEPVGRPLGGQLLEPCEVSSDGLPAGEPHLPASLFPSLGHYGSLGRLLGCGSGSPAEDEAARSPQEARKPRFGSHDEAVAFHLLTQPNALAWVQVALRLQADGGGVPDARLLNLPETRR